MVTNPSEDPTTPRISRSRKLITLTVITALVLATLLAACGSEPEPEADREDTPAEQSAATGETTADRTEGSANENAEPTATPSWTPVPVTTAVYLTPERPTATPDPTPTPTTAGEPEDAPTPTPAPAPVIDGDYDADDDGLIEIRDLAQLNAIRYDMDGDGVADDANGQAAYLEAYPDPADGMGCSVGGCVGYELVADLDLDTNRSGGPDSGDAYWNSGAGWDPAGLFCEVQ